MGKPEEMSTLRNVLALFCRQQKEAEWGCSSLEEAAGTAGSVPWVWPASRAEVHLSSLTSGDTTVIEGNVLRKDEMNREG